MSAERHFDVVVLGGGGVSDVLAPALAQAGVSVAVVEANRVGGECPYVACMPSKAMLHAAREHRGSGFDQRAYAEAVRRRDQVAEHRDDSRAAAALTESGVTLLRGTGRISADREVTVSGERVGCDRLVLATGSAPVVPRIDGIESVTRWSSEEALSNEVLPRRVLVLGGGPVGCELADVYASFGSEVTLVDIAPRLLAAEEPVVGDTLRGAFESRSVRVITGCNVLRAHPVGGASALEIEGGEELVADVIVVVAGRRPRVPAGFERFSIALSDAGGIPVDDHLRVPGADDVWAGGDVTAIAPFTHTASYHGRVLAANLNGGDVIADHTAIPRTVYTEPPVACAGMTSAKARDAGCDVIIASHQVSDTARSLTDESRLGSLTLIADRTHGVLTGAAAIGARADEWIGEAVLAIRARVPLQVLAGTVHPFPTFSELYEAPLRELAAQLQQR